MRVRQGDVEALVFQSFNVAVGAHLIAFAHLLVADRATAAVETAEDKILVLLLLRRSWHRRWRRRGFVGQRPVGCTPDVKIGANVAFVELLSAETTTFVVFPLDRAGLLYVEQTHDQVSILGEGLGNSCTYII